MHCAFQPQIFSMSSHGIKQQMKIVNERAVACRPPYLSAIKPGAQDNSQAAPIRCLDVHPSLCGRMLQNFGAPKQHMLLVFLYAQHPLGLLLRGAAQCTVAIAIALPACASTAYANLPLRSGLTFATSTPFRSPRLFQRDNGGSAQGSAWWQGD
jgi:hypothetical protein